MNTRKMIRSIGLMIITAAFLVHCSQFLTEPDNKKNVVLHFSLGYGYDPDVAYFIKSSHKDLNKESASQKLDQQYDRARVMVLDLSKYRSPEELFSTTLWADFISAQDSFYVNDTVGSWTQWKALLGDYFSIVSDQNLAMTADSARGTVVGVVGLNRVIVGFNYGDTIKYEGEIDIMATEEGGEIGGDNTLEIFPYESGASAVTELFISPDIGFLSPGETLQFTCVAIYADQTHDTVTTSADAEWFSSPGLVGSIGATGLYTANTQQTGVDTVIAIFRGGLEARALVVVEPQAPVLSGLIVTPASDTLFVAENRQFIATGIFSNGTTQNVTTQASWSVVPDYIATIDAVGFLTASESGEGYVIASLGGFQDSARIVVEEIPVFPVRLEILPEDTALFNGQMVHFECNLVYSDSSRIDVTLETQWSVMPQFYGFMESGTGLFTAATSGTGVVTITGQYGGMTGTTSLTVQEVQLVSIRIESDTLILGNEQNWQYRCTGFYNDQSTQDLTDFVTWNSTPGTAGVFEPGGLFFTDYDLSGTETVTASYQGKTDNAIIIVVPMISIPAGMFWQGDSSGNTDEVPEFETYISFYEIDKTEVTNAMYVSFLRNNIDSLTVTPATVSSPLGQEFLDLDGPDCQINYVNGEFVIDEGKENHPVVEVTWFGAARYAQFYGKRLPTESEWEKASRGGDQRTYPWGNVDPTTGHCNFNNNVGETTPVGQYSPTGDSPSNCYDMAGNVMEWVNDWYDATFYQVLPSSDPIGPTSGTNRVIRGGSWMDPGQNVRCADRNSQVPGTSTSAIGFRCAR